MTGQAKTSALQSVQRYLAAAGTGADLAWRWKNDAKSLPAKTPGALPDGPEPAVMREPDAMPARHRREPRNHAAPRFPDTIARLVTFMIMTETASGKRKDTRARVPATPPDHEGKTRPAP